ncbi:uncharacterized protein TOL2_C22900 [Desulfobacula toluolica Tol2]|uniref:Uncharacterized protein n=1 Tax=Desulfobacula toluolica (strain DSM 7467 / Tol2) TaxID=651182 RepID=K0NGS9_DESTT|nr:uncharacterized protein TOL2_C22900 [Desulfobacula toluolica Tol2]
MESNIFHALLWQHNLPWPLFKENFCKTKCNILLENKSVNINCVQNYVQNYVQNCETLIKLRIEKKKKF